MEAPAPWGEGLLCPPPEGVVVDAALVVVVYLGQGDQARDFFYCEIRQIREKEGVLGAFLLFFPKTLMGIIPNEVSGYENFAYLACFAV